MARLEKQSTATYCAVINDNGELNLGLGDMDIHQQITEHYVSSCWQIRFCVRLSALLTMQKKKKSNETCHHSLKTASDFDVALDR